MKSKHFKEDKNKTQSIFEEIPSQLQRHEKRFIFNSLEKNARYREYGGVWKIAK